MLEKPDLHDRLIISCLETEYGLRARQLTFLPLGADVNTAVFRAVVDDGAVYFMKLRKGDPDEIILAAPHFLHAQGIRAIIPPLETRARQLWADLEPYKLILYPFIDGKDGYEVPLTDRQWLDFGAALKGVHTAQLPPELRRRIPCETFSAEWRELVREFQSQAETTSFVDPVAAQLAAFLRSHRSEIDRLVSRGNRLGCALRARSLEHVLCHTDIHPGNLHICPPHAGGAIYIVDWDAPRFAPREHDLTLIGGCSFWSDPRQVALFYQGYGCDPAQVDRMALVYYRIERMILDIAAYCQQLLLSDAGGADREQSLRYLSGSFLPGCEVDLALKT
jgi:spectinomycin phosphotransferase